MLFVLTFYFLFCSHLILFCNDGGELIQVCLLGRFSWGGKSLTVCAASQAG